MKLIPRLRPKTGLTLVELIMTIVVLGIVAIPISLFISRNTESVFYCEDLTIALNLARWEMEKINNTDYGKIAIGTFLSPDYPEYNYGVTRIVAYAQGDANSKESLKKITVEVKKTGDMNVLVSLVTYIAKNVSYGL